MTMKNLKMKKSFMMTIDNEEDDHHEVESNIEVDGDNDNNMQPKFYKPPAFNSKKRKLRHSLSEAVAENRNNAR